MVLDVLNAGSSLSHLLGVKDKIFTSINLSREESANVSTASAESIEKREIHESLVKIFKSLGYLTEAGVSAVIISPDIFAEFMKKAKTNEMKLYKIPDMKETFKKLDFKAEEWLPPSDMQNGFKHTNEVRYAFFVCFLSIVIGLTSYLIYKIFV